MSVYSASPLFPVRSLAPQLKLQLPNNNKCMSNILYMCVWLLNALNRSHVMLISFDYGTFHSFGSNFPSFATTSAAAAAAARPPVFLRSSFVVLVFFQLQLVRH